MNKMIAVKIVDETETTYFFDIQSISLANEKDLVLDIGRQHCGQKVLVKDIGAWDRHMIIYRLCKERNYEDLSDYKAEFID